MTFDELLLIVKDMLPERNELPMSTYEAKKVVCPLGLEVENIHACPNDCILYRGKEYEKLEAYFVCGAQCYKISRDDPCYVEGVKTKKKRKKKKRKKNKKKKKRNRIPVKVV
jgi:hypothetical protein